MKINNIENLNVFKKAHLLTLRLYEITGMFPKMENFGLISQIRRAAVSINSNLMEGGARNTIGEYKHFIGIARGSVAELKYPILVSKDVKFITDETYNYVINELEHISKMLTGLINSADSDDRRLTTDDK